MSALACQGHGALTDLGTLQYEGRKENESV